MRMSAVPANLLNLNVDALFEQHSVPDIDGVHKKIQTVVENKREELRTMVGERYRDLLKAADTIAAMQTSAGTLIEQVRCVHANCRSLNEQQLLGFQTATPQAGTDVLLQQRSASKQLHNYFSTMAQIKLLTALPELIWTHIDQEQFYAATELFIFSRHISTGLQLDAQNALMQQLPVARKQWEILRPFHATIKLAVLAALERELLSTELALECLHSLLLLDKCDLGSVLRTFLQLRAAAFLRCLREQPTSGAADVDRRRRVKERILASLAILNGTVELLDKCLLGNGLLYGRLAELALPSAAPSIARMDSSERQLAHLLPEIIAGYRPKCEVAPLSESQLCAALQQWLAQIDELAKTQLQQLFALVGSMQTIQDIKAASQQQQRQGHAQLAQQLKLESRSLDFYESKYLPLINGRVREIIRSSWSTAMQQTYERVRQRVEQPPEQPQPLEIWREQNSDLPASLAAALSDEPRAKRLANRTKGYDAATLQLCGDFDAQLAEIVRELNVLLAEQATSAEDKLTLIEFLRETAQQQLSQFLQQLRELQLVERQALLQALRSSLALIELCPHLKLCFCPPSGWRQWTGQSSAAGVEHWQRICSLLENQTLEMWLLVVDDLLAAHSCSQSLPSTISHDVVLQDFALWQTQTLEQRDEDPEQEQAVQSTIRIPSQPRLSLQTYLFELIGVLNDAVPQTLPPKVLHAFNQRLLGQLLSHYQALAATQCTQSSQNVALQLHFDLRFLQRVFAITREDRALYEQFQELQRKLRDLIDPFDFELFAEHIKEQVARSAARLHGELGVMTPAPPPGSQTAASVSALAHEPDPNVLCLSSSGSTSLWFPLLPIVMPQAAGNSERKTGQPLEAEKEALAVATPTRKSTARKGETNKAKSGAASFFGMSQEWFR